MIKAQEHLARQWAEKELQRVAGDVGSTAAAEFILEHTEPGTMADVEWDDEKHHLAGVTAPGGHDVVMMWRDDTETGNIVTDRGEWRPDLLISNGKRYELREVTEPEHPVVLETLNDYVGAPEGTIIATAHGAPWVKELGDWRGGDRPATSESIAYQPRMVLRWGWDA